jgi:hypothetical protein
MPEYFVVRGEFEFLIPVEEAADEQAAMDSVRWSIEDIGGRVLRREETDAAALTERLREALAGGTAGA